MRTPIGMGRLGAVCSPEPHMATIAGLPPKVLHSTLAKAVVTTLAAVVWANISLIWISLPLKRGE